MRYRILGELGSGASGRVFRAFDRLREREVALKVLRCDDGGALGAREFRLLASHQHPHLVQVFDFGRSNTGNAFFSMELLRGQPIDAFLRDRFGGPRAVDPAEATAREGVVSTLAVQILDALRVIHTRGILHLDLKPSNVFVVGGELAGGVQATADSTGDSTWRAGTSPAGPVAAKLLDFGLSAAAAAESRSGGTLAYAAPERLQGKPATRSSDLFSLGAVLYELLTGRIPHDSRESEDDDGADFDAVVRRRIAGDLDVAGLSALLATTISRLLAPLPEDRPGTAAEVLASLQGDADRLSDPLPPFDTAFVGRERLLGALTDVPDDASDSRPRRWLLEGDPGIGKSRVLREAEIRLQLAGAVVGREGAEGTLRSPGSLLYRVLRQLELAEVAPTLEFDALESVSPSADPVAEPPSSHVDHASWSEPFRARLRRAARAERGGASDASLAESQARLDGVLHEFVRLVLEHCPSRRVLLVDDIDGTDSLSRAGLLTLLRAIEHRDDVPLSLVFACDVASDLAQELRDGSSAWSQLRHHRLEPLSLGEVELFLDQIFGVGEAPDGLPAFLVDEAGGHPAFITEYLRWAIDSGNLRQSGRSWELRCAPSEPAKVPETVEDALLRRIGTLPGEAQSWLQWLALAQRPLGVAELVELQGGETNASEVDLELARLARAQFVVRNGSVYQPANAALARVAYATMDSAEREQRHTRWVDRLAAHLAGDVESESALAEVAEHIYRSSYRKTDRSRVFNVLSQSGEQARCGGALREALQHFRHALEVCDDDRKRFDVLLADEELSSFLGRSERRQKDLTRLEELAEKLDTDCRREVTLRRAGFLESVGRRREALELLRGSLHGDDGDGGARVLVRCGYIQVLLGEWDEAFTDLRAALEIGERRGDEDIQAEALQLVGVAHYRRGEFGPAIEFLSRCLALRRAQGQVHRVGALESNLALVHLDRGDLEAARERFGAALQLFRRLGVRRGEAVSLLNLGLVDLDRGRPESALDSISLALEIRRELGDRRAEGADLGNLAEAWLRLGYHERAVPLLEEALRRASEFENVQSRSANLCRLGWLEAERGNLRQARVHLDEAVESAGAAGLPTQEVEARLHRARAGFDLVADHAETRVAAFADAECALDRARKHSLGFQEIEAASALARLARLTGDLAAARRYSTDAVRLLEGKRDAHAAAQLVWLEHHKVLDACRQAAPEDALDDPPSEVDCDTALRRAYTLLRQRADWIEDGELRRSYLDQIAAHREIQQLHESFQALVRRDAERRERSFHEIAKSIHSVLELDPLLNRLLELAIETTHAEKGLILLRHPEGHFITRAARGMERESVADATDICRSVLDDVTHGGKPVLASDAGNDARFRDRESVISFQIRTLMCVPMVVRDETIGAVYVDGRGAASFDAPDLDYLVAFAQLAAIAVENARLLDALRAENADLRREVESRYRFENLLAQSPAMDKVIHRMEKVAQTSASILILGETGTGKEVVARSIHCASPRRQGAFVTVDCGALPENLLESELFGHAKGAFSGAIHDRVGLFEEADGGTLFLDEITNTSLDLQAKLLRVLQEGEVRRVGENRVAQVDVRIIAATNVDLRAAVAEGRFREDLYYRLDVVSIELPPLRHRREDIPLLAQHFLKKSCARYEKQLDGFTAEAMRVLSTATWRGNVRELENAVEKAAILAEGPRLDAEFVASLLRSEPQPSTTGTAEAPAPGAGVEEASRPGDSSRPSESSAAVVAESLEAFDRSWKQAERDYLERLVDEAGGNLAEAARRAQVRNRNSLVSRLKKHGIERKRGKS